MGDGGIACVSLQPIMEKFPNSESFCGSSNSNNNGKGKGKVDSTNKTVKRTTTKRMKLKRDAFFKKEEPEKAADKANEKGEVVENAEKEEVEEGELGTLKSPKREVENGEVKQEMSVKGEIEKGEIVGYKGRKDEVEKGEIVPEKCCKDGAERHGFNAGGRSRSDLIVKRERSPDHKWRVPKDDVEKGEFIPERWHHKGETFRDEYVGYMKPRRERERRYEPEWTPPSMKYSGDDTSPGRDFNRSGNHHPKRIARWEINQERNYPKISSKFMDDLGSHKNDFRSHGREHSSNNRLKRQGTDSDTSDRKVYDDHGDYASSKSRRLSGEGCRSAHSEHCPRQSSEKSFRNSNPSRAASDRLSMRHYDSPSARGHERYRRSPSYSERSSPLERSKYHDHTDRTPARYERSPGYHDPRDRTPTRYERSPGYHDLKDRTPARHERSPGYYDHKNCTPARHERSPGYHDHRDRSPARHERSPGYHDYRDRTPVRHERSPSYRGYRQDSRLSPSYSERSSHNGGKVCARKDRSPSYVERSPHHRIRPSNHRQMSKKIEVSETKEILRVQEEKLNDKNSSDGDSICSAKDVRNEVFQNGVETTASHDTNATTHVPESPGVDGMEQPSVINGFIDELPSMEEDMDICDTPPHVPTVANVNPGKWYYIDHYGEECGPSKLCDLKGLVEEGYLISDHLIKHSDSDRWMTVENAASPVTMGSSTIFSDSVTQLVSPPQAPGNLLIDVGDANQFGNQVCMDYSDDIAMGFRLDERVVQKDHSIDDRVGALLEGFTVVPGKELEVVGEVLQVTFDQSEWERFGSIEGIFHDHPSGEECSEFNPMEDGRRYSAVKESAESTSTASFDKEYGYSSSEFTEWFSGRWTCKGGDWQRNEETVQDKLSRRKIVLNDGYPLCQMPKSGYEDPRWQRKDDLYFPCPSKKLDLPSWAICGPDEKNESNVVIKAGQTKPATRGIKGIMMPVIRINACVVKDPGTLSDSRSKQRVCNKYSLKNAKHYSLSSDLKTASEDDTLPSKSLNEHDSVINKPKDRVCSVEDLQLNVGSWFYLDGAGHERGPFSSASLKSLVEEGCLKLHSSVYRKMDRLWVPVSSVMKALEHGVKLVKENITACGESYEATGFTNLGRSAASSSFHKFHPQFIGYTLGKLHELVMKSYRSREFAAAINEVLDPWILSRQPKKEMEKHLYYKQMSKGSLYKWPLDGELSILNEDDMQVRKRCRTLTAGVDEGYGMSVVMQPPCYGDPSFEDLCANAMFSKQGNEYSDTPVSTWGLLDGHILARIFHFLRADVKSLLFSALTCKHWRASVGFYKNVCVRVDLSTFGSDCSDSVIGSVMKSYNKQMIKALVLEGCTNITSSALEDILQAFSCISSVDIRGCSQFEELIIKFPHVTWLKERSIIEDSNLRSRSLRQMLDKNLSASKSGHRNYMEESSGLKDYFEMVEKRGAANQAFRRNLYKRTKISDSRKSALVLAREARLRHWAMKKAGTGHRKMEEFLVFSLKDIMMGNTSDYLARKVGEIENRVKSGYYARRGLNYAKQDILKMCNEAMKLKHRGDGGDMDHAIPLFIKLGARLDESFKTATDTDEVMKKFRDETSVSSGYKKSNKIATERKHMSRGNYMSYLNGGSVLIEYSSERELRKNVSRMNKKLDSDSNSSDEFEFFSDDTRSDSGSVSDTASDSDVRLESSAFDAKEGCFSADEGFDFIPDDREWGARMTKASLVPPVTRKYDVIDQYVIVADEVEVQRKMRVSLPDDYENKVAAQKNGSEEGDMEIPEVKEYKPRKQLGEEVIEQEVYGIDPYTHNLLLDSMPDDVDWPLGEKHVFVEDVILQVLNKQVRQYTGSGSTPMTYPLKPVIEEILGTAKQELNSRNVKLSEALLQAIDSRPEDNYVGHRKGLGVVCNKQGGFTEDDFVVEFLGEVYPAWKWFEKQDGIRSLQKNSKEPAPEFYNIYLERPKGDADGYDLVVVDAMHKANYASRICHSCRPNCEAKVTAVGGQYQIGIYSVRPIGFGEEITFDYNSVTESKEEYEASVCLCGSQVCRGSYLNLTGEGAFETVLEKRHGLLDRHCLLLEACELNGVSEDDYVDLAKAGLGSCLLGDLPDWLIAYSARLVRFINFERTKLPDEILKHNLDEKKKYYAEISVEMERSDAEIQAEGVYSQRLQNLALTLDKVRYVLRCVFGDPKKAPPPLQKLCPEEMVSALWNGEGSLVDELLQSIAPHVDNRVLQDLKQKIRAHDPSMSGNIERELRKSLLWLRDEVRDLNCTYKSRNDAAADLIHIYAYTKCFFKIREYKTVTSPPVYITPLDLGPKCANKLSGVTEYCKTYSENYCLGQLVFWYNQTKADPDRELVKKSRGCLSLPEIGSFYAKAQTPTRQRVYGPQTVKYMLARMEKKPQNPWPTERIWSFKSTLNFFGSPMLDAVLNGSQVERDMLIWLKNRPAMFRAPWDR